jgi:hypothetical protein
MKKLIKTLFFCFLLIITIQGKTQSMQLPDIQACIGDTVESPITMSAINNVGAITLYISYDTTAVKFIDMFNINSLASGVLFNDVKNTAGQLLGKIAISWVTSTAGINFSQGIFSELKFKILNGNTNLLFTPDCEIADYQSAILTVGYTNGSISVPATPFVLVQPDLYIISSQNAKITITSQNALFHNWQIKSGSNWINLQNNSDFQGVESDTLYLNNLNSITNNSLFRCKLSNECETTYSDSVTVITTTLKNFENEVFIISPNPFNDHIIIQNLNSHQILELKIFQIDGKQLKINKSIFDNNYIINNLVFLNKGIYFLEIVTDDSKYRQTYKLIKN